MALLRPILKQALLHPTRTAVVDDLRTWSYAKLVGGAYFLSRAIRQHTDQERVGLMLPTSGAFPAALLGTWQAGRTAVPLNYLLSRDDLHHVIRDSGLDTVFTASKLLDVVGEDMIPEGINVVRLDRLNFKGLPPVRWPAAPRDDDLAVLLYTSGTSGKPKGVMLSHRALDANVRAIIDHAELGPTNKFLGVLPQFHAFGVTALTLMPLVLGAEVIYTARFVPRKLVELMREHKPNVFIAVPSMYGALLSVKSATREDFAPLEFAVSGAEPLSQAVFDAYKDKFDCHLLEGYGLTETAPVTNWSTPQQNKLHAVGKALPGVTNVIVDDDNNILGPNASGEILIAGPNVMDGYWQLPEKTAEVFVDLDLPGRGKTKCFRTGDIGKLDDEGYLYITGRKKEMLIVGGENVFPREIEEILNIHPSVKASAVVGKQDDMRGEVPVAFVELEEDAEFNETDLRNFVRDKIAQYKVPREIRQIDALPRNPTGKILRRELKV
ncbi:MAG: class I adenylate-forming enzyme family protein [Phycisphaeraceae bacterium]